MTNNHSDDEFICLEDLERKTVNNRKTISLIRGDFQKHVRYKTLLSPKIKRETGTEDKNEFNSLHLNQIEPIRAAF